MLNIPLSDHKFSLKTYLAVTRAALSRIYFSKALFEHWFAANHLSLIEQMLAVETYSKCQQQLCTRNTHLIWQPHHTRRLTHRTSPPPFLYDGCRAVHLHTADTQPLHWHSDKAKDKRVGVTIYLLHSSYWTIWWCTSCTVLHWEPWVLHWVLCGGLLFQLGLGILFSIEGSDLSSP